MPKSIGRISNFPCVYHRIFAAKIPQLVRTIAKFTSKSIIISNLPEMPLKSMYGMFNDHPTSDIHKNIRTRLTWGHTFKHTMHHI